MPFVFVTNYRKQPTLRVSFREGSKLWAGKTKNYPLTKAGCLQAGRDIFKSGAKDWTNSSSVDFPQETKPGFRWDVQELMADGFRAALEEFSRPQKELVGMILTHCEGEAFQSTLTGSQKALFKLIAEKTRRGE